MNFQNFSDYAEKGLSVMPCRGKHSLLSWKKYQEKIADEDSLKEWDKSNHNIAIVTGEVSGIVVIDLDGEYPEDWPEMPKTWTAKTAKGYHYYFKMPDFKIRNKTGFVKGVDVRANGGYVIAPPSRHESGVNYEWIIDPSHYLLSLPDWLADKLKPEKKPERKKVEVQNYSDNEPYIEEAIKQETDALQNAIEGTRNHQLNTSAFSLSQLMPANKVEQILTPIALSIGLNAVETKKTIQSGIGGGSAQPREIPDKSIPVELPDGDCNLVRTIIKKYGKKIEHAEINPELIDNAPGLVGQLSQWIVNTSLYPQPVLALASAIPTIGNIMAHRVATETNLRTNFFTLGVAESGAGKEHARRCIAKLYEHTGLTETILGDPASATAVINSVKRANGRGIMMIDEFGRYLESVNGKQAASHTKMIATNMMYLFNAAGDIFTGQEYANNDINGGRSDIDQPCLGIYATTVPGRFYNSLTKEEAFDGFLARWLVFETNRFDIEPTLGNRLGEPPQSLREEIKYWNTQPTFYGEGGDIAAYTTIRPRVVNFKDTSGYYAYIKDCRRKMASSDNPIEKAFWNRAAEHAAKLALVAHTGDSIDEATFEWAKSLATALTESMINNINENISESLYEKEMKKILKIIKSCGAKGASLSDLSQKARFCSRKQRQEYLDTLTEAGDIELEIDDSQKKPKKIYKAN